MAFLFLFGHHSIYFFSGKRGFMDLSEDDLLCILKFLPVKDKLNVRQTCKKLHHIVMTETGGVKDAAVLVWCTYGFFGHPVDYQEWLFQS